MSNTNIFIFFFQAEDGIRDSSVTGVQTCALPIFGRRRVARAAGVERRQRPADDLVRRVAKDRSGAGVPAQHGAFGIEDEHGAVRQVLDKALQQLSPVDVATHGTYLPCFRYASSSTSRTRLARSI